MVKRRGIIGAALALLLSAGALVCVSGCTPRQARFDSGSARAAESTAAILAFAESTAAPLATTESPTVASKVASKVAEAAAAAPAPSVSASGSSSASGLSARDASALDAELSAIQSELDRLSVPSDSDFDSIGSGLK